ncbi:MAG: dUTP diphosphatase [Pyrinomonadaceae bacterium]
MKQKIQFTKLQADATLPARGSEFAAGLDLFSCIDVVLGPGEFKPINTGVAVAIPDGYYGRVAPRSGLAFKHGVDALAGVVDSDYRGEIVCILINHGPQPVEFKVGDRIAQMVIEAIIRPEPEWADQLEITARGASGFGSTGR